MKYFQHELPFFSDHCFTVIRRCAVLFNALLVSLLKRRHPLFWLSIIMDFFLFDLLNHGFIDLENYTLGIQIAVFFLWSAQILKKTSVFEECYRCLRYATLRFLRACYVKIMQKDFLGMFMSVLPPNISRNPQDNGSVCVLT